PPLPPLPPPNCTNAVSVRPPVPVAMAASRGLRRLAVVAVIAAAVVATAILLLLLASPPRLADPDHAPPDAPWAQWLPAAADLPLRHAPLSPPQSNAPVAPASSLPTKSGLTPPQPPPISSVAGNVTACSLRDLPVPTRVEHVYDKGSSVRYRAVMNRLAELCKQHYQDADGTAHPYMLTARFAAAGPGTRDLFLNTCYPIEIVLKSESDGRSTGQCADFVHYLVYAGARLSDRYDDDTLREKIARCPHSTYLHGEHVVETIFKSAAASPAAGPGRLRNLWLPNLEQVRLEQYDLFPQSHALLAKTRITADVLQAYVDKTLPSDRRPPVLYVSHTSPDVQVEPAPDSGVINYDALYDDRTSQNYDSFLHAFGKSPRKHTVEVIQCWLRHPDWPTLTVVGSFTSDSMFAHVPGAPAEPPANIRMLPFVEPHELRTIARTHGVHLCPSYQEGYGHYLNLARAASAVLITSSHPPMSEFVGSPDGPGAPVVARAGVLLEHRPPLHEAYQLLFGEFVSPAHITADQ
ncbi:hypothetical protein HK405_014932, partial [Cladochytrium tenue]